MRLIFSKGEWITVHLPKGYDPCWSPSDTWFYAAMWASSIRKGHDEKKATVLAEAAVTKRMYPETLYDPVLEKSIIELFD